MIVEFEMKRNYLIWNWLIGYFRAYFLDYIYIYLKFTYAIIKFIYIFFK